MGGEEAGGIAGQGAAFVQRVMLAAFTTTTVELGKVRSNESRSLRAATGALAVVFMLSLGETVIAEARRRKERSMLDCVMQVGCDE